eukprot:TRINITY_DN1347_c0_g1_i2.p1 TRINITY_DN1347_c0_g1~~TRINITY_DN1347_c0_g1_i2.p1  ORF type:complete len:1021 (+),score=158.62 TRINITY_DN1347_c0_g1_i2:100-3162(+)
MRRYPEQPSYVTGGGGFSGGGYSPMGGVQGGGGPLMINTGGVAQQPVYGGGAPINILAHTQQQQTGGFVGMPPTGPTTFGPTQAGIGAPPLSGGIAPGSGGFGAVRSSGGTAPFSGPAHTGGFSTSSPFGAPSVLPPPPTGPPVTPPPTDGSAGVQQQGQETHNPYSLASSGTEGLHAGPGAPARRVYPAEPDPEGFSNYVEDVGAATQGMGGMNLQGQQQRPLQGQQPSPAFGAGVRQPTGAQADWDAGTKPDIKAQCPEAFLRMTVNAVPNSSQLLQKAAIPFGCIVQPLASPPDYSIPVFNFGKMGIPRCRRCRAYVNPFVHFIDGGRCWRCNMCGLPNDVTAEYFCELDQTGRRLDHETRPELSRGCVEYIAPAEYMVRRPMPPTYFFVIDVSYYSVSSGMLKTCVETIKATLSSLPDPVRSNVGFITFDNTVHFYHLKSSLTKPRMLVVSDIDDVFLPLPDDMLVNLNESRTVIDSLLDSLPAIHQYTQGVEVAVGPALKAAWNVMRLVGGKMMLFLGKMPSLGLATLKMREDTKLLGTDKEVELLLPDKNFYEEFALDCSRQQIAVDTFLFSPQYTDVATLASMSRITCGQTFYYPAFSWAKDGEKFSGDLRHVLTRETGWEGVMRVRASKGLKVTAHYGNFSVRSADLLALPAVDSDKAFGVQLAVTENLTAVKYISIQNALLYTTSSGERRIRVATVCLPVTPHLADMFKYADCEAVVALTSKMAVDKALKFKLSDAREALVHKCIDVLAAYRASFATGASTQTQLLLPESLKSLPLYTLALVKSIALRSGNDIRPDERSYYLSLLRQMSATDTIRFLYPSLYAIHLLGPEDGTPAPVPVPSTTPTVSSTPPPSHRSFGAPAPTPVSSLPVDHIPPVSRPFFHLPPTMRLTTTEKMEQQGVYLLNDGCYLLLWVGRAAAPELLQALFGVPVLDDQHLYLARQGNDYSERVCNIVDTLRGQHPPYQKLYVIREGDPMEYRFFSHFVEDKNKNGLPNYYEFLVQLQRQIQTRAK